MAARVIRLASGIKLERPRSARWPWQVVAPLGQRFCEGPHALTSAWSEQEARELAAESPLEPCPEDCDCTYEPPDLDTCSCAGCGGNRQHPEEG